MVMWLMMRTKNQNGSQNITRSDTIELRGFDDDCSTTTYGDEDSEKSGQAPISGKLNPPARSTPTKR